MPDAQPRPVEDAQPHISDKRRRYFRFQLDLTRDYLVPWLTDAGALTPGGRVLEVGAGEAGALSALVEAADVEAWGLELSASRLAVAKQLAAERGVDLHLAQADITEPEDVAPYRGRFDLVVLRDVIEHIEAPRLHAAVEHLRSMLAPGGRIAFTFPPYYSPFGGHQQILSRRRLKLPWWQAAPWFLPVVERMEPRETLVEEMKSLARCRLTIDAFERALEHAHLSVLDRRFWLVRPAFKYRYGLMPIAAPRALAAQPTLREAACTAAWYLVGAEGP